MDLALLRATEPNLICEVIVVNSQPAATAVTEKYKLVQTDKAHLWAVRPQLYFCIWNLFLLWFFCSGPEVCKTKSRVPWMSDSSWPADPGCAVVLYLDDPLSTTLLQLTNPNRTLKLLHTEGLPTQNILWFKYKGTYATGAFFFSQLAHLLLLKLD